MQAGIKQLTFQANFAYNWDDWNLKTEIENKSMANYIPGNLTKNNPSSLF
jgi:hypothetical protein